MDPDRPQEHPPMLHMRAAADPISDESARAALTVSDNPPAPARGLGQVTRATHQAEPGFTVPFA
jgi:hypothetical protein